MIFNLTCASGRTLFQELEYIQSDGRQYIDPEINLPSLSYLRITSAYTFLNASESIVPIFAQNDYTGLGNRFIFQRIAPSNALQFSLNGLGNSIANGAEIGARKSFDLKVGPTGISITGDISFSYSGSMGSFPYEDMRLFGGWTERSRGTLDAYYGSIRLEATDIYTGSETNKAREYVPVKRIRDGVCGFFDKISMEFKPSEGSAPFIGGPEVPGSIIVV